MLHVNDGESQLLGIDAEGDGEREFGNVARFATLADNLRESATSGKPAPGHAGKRGALLLSSGDNFLAGPEFAASLDKGAPFYDALAMLAMDFDAAPPSPSWRTTAPSCPAPWWRSAVSGSASSGSPPPRCPRSPAPGTSRS